MSENEIENRKKALLENIQKYFPEEYDKVSNVLKNLNDESILLQYIEKKETKIKEYKKIYTNKSYTEENETYYGNITKDETIYDPNKEKDKKEIEKSLEKATKDFLDINPLEIHDEKQYSNFIRANIIYDEQIGYRVIENENGNFHVILKESTYYIYPSKELSLSDTNIINICNNLFKTDLNKELAIGDEIYFDGIEPAQIFMPFVAVKDDPINQLTRANILIAEGIAVDEKFKNKEFKETVYPNIKNKVFKGKLKLKPKTLTPGEVPSIEEDFRYQEELILEPKLYKELTFIPQPRKQDKDELYEDYVEYLINHYKYYGYELKFNEENEPIYPHVIENGNEDIKEETKEENLDEKFGFDKFISARFNGVNTNKLDKSVLVVYLKAYRQYLTQIKQTNPEAEIYINENINEADEAIESIKNNRVF